MPWVRFDDTFSVHRKVEGLSDAAFRLHVSAVFWCARNLTDGFVPEEDLELVTARVRSPERFTAELVRRGLWHRAEAVTRNGTVGVTRNAAVEGYETDCDSPECPAPEGAGWVIHDYLEYQPSKEKVRDEQSKNADRQRRYRERQAAKKQVNTAEDQSRNGVTNASRDASDDASHDGDRNGVSNGEQTPPRPDPTRIESSNELSLFDADAVEQETDEAPPRRKPETDAPDDFPITEKMRGWARKEVPSIAGDLERHTKDFLDFHAAKGNRFRDWSRAWHKWMRKAAEIESDRRNSQPSGGFRRSAPSNRSVSDRSSVKKWKKDQ